MQNETTSAQVDAEEAPLDLADVDAVLGMPQAKQMKPIETLTDFANLIVQWHHHMQHMLHHLTNIPQGAKLDHDIDGEAKEIFLNGDVHTAFRLGVLAAMNELESLPFKAEVQPEPDPSDNDAKPAE